MDIMPTITIFIIIMIANIIPDMFLNNILVLFNHNC